MPTTEPTLIELLLEAADMYGMPIGTGDRLRDAAQRLRQEMERYDVTHGQWTQGSQQTKAAAVFSVLQRINGGADPLHQDTCGQCGGPVHRSFSEPCRILPTPDGTP